MEAEPICRHISDLMSDPDMAVGYDWVMDMREKYPSFTLPAALLLKRSPDTITAQQRKELVSWLALAATDREAILAMFDPTEQERAMFYPAEKPAAPVTTDKAIDTFLNTYGSSSPEEDALLERLIFNPVPDYAGVLEAQAKALDEPDMPMSGQDALINAFIKKESETETAGNAAEEEQVIPAPAESPETKETEVQDPPLLSQSLAKFFIKQRRYDKAYEIISNLSLNYPEKSIYFADQLRFLQKLIINQRYSNKENQ